MKYELINTKNKEEHLCDKVTIDGFDYYVIDENPSFEDENKYCFSKERGLEKVSKASVDFLHKSFCVKKSKKVIATNNPNIDIPKVVDDYKNASWCAADLYGYDKNCELPTNDVEVNSFIEGYNKSQETHSNSDEDMVDFYEWCDTSEEATIFWKRNKVDPDMSGNHWKKIRENREKLLQLWKEQKSKIIYYNG